MNLINKPIITSILDTDLYKLTMQQLVFHQYPNTTVAYEFYCRNQNISLGYLKDEIIKEIAQWGDIRLTAEEKSYLETIRFLKPDYIEFLSNYKFNPSLVKVGNSNGVLTLTIRGNWLDTILFEVPILSTVNELYFRGTTNFEEIRNEGEKRLNEKLLLLRTRPRLFVMEFGTRRRYSKLWQDYAFSNNMANHPNFNGTSNVLLAMKNKVTARGTMAHELISAHLRLVDNIRQAQKRAFYVWLQEYENDLGIALSDTFTSNAFFADFDSVLSKMFGGIRQDSGDPFVFGFKAIEHYKKNGIDPRTKTIVFSDGLTIPFSIEIFDTFTGMFDILFGIGTDLTNDMGVKPINIVIKMVECNNFPVVKLSDNISKAIGDKNTIEAIKNAYYF